MTMNVLVTGFGPFPGAPINPTQALVDRLVHSRRLKRRGLFVRGQVAPTTYDALSNFPAPIEHFHPAIVLLLGLASRRRALCVEMRAKNHTRFTFPDANGHYPPSPLVMPRFRPIKKTRAAVAPLVTAMNGNGVEARASIDAGGYLCNALYYRSLLRWRTGEPLVLFVHVPKPAPTAGRLPSGRNRHRRFSLDAMTHALEAAIDRLRIEVRRERLRVTPLGSIPA